MPPRPIKPSKTIAADIESSYLEALEGEKIIDEYKSNDK